MPDSLGHRMKFGVIAPSTNTSVQPEFDAMAPPGITNHMSRIHVPDNPINNDDDFNKLVGEIAKYFLGRRSILEWRPRSTVSARLSSVGGSQDSRPW